MVGAWGEKVWGCESTKNVGIRLLIMNRDGECLLFSSYGKGKNSGLELNSTSNKVF